MVTKNLMKLYLNLTLNKLHQFNLLYITLLYLVHSRDGLQSKKCTALTVMNIQL